MNSWRRLRVVLLSVALIGVACSSTENVSTGDVDEGAIDGQEFADVEWLFGTAWTVLSSDGAPIDTPVTLTFSRRDGELLLDVIDDCGSTARLTPFAGVYDVQPFGGEDCLSPTNVRDQLVHEVGQLRLDQGADGLLLIRTAGDVLIVAEHFQSTSIQTDVALTPEPETTSGDFVTAEELLAFLEQTEWRVTDMTGFSAPNRVDIPVSFGETVLSHVPCNAQHHNLEWEDGGYRVLPTPDYATTLIGCGTPNRFDALGSEGDFVQVTIVDDDRIELRHGDRVVLLKRSP